MQGIQPTRCTIVPVPLCHLTQIINISRNTPRKSICLLCIRVPHTAPLPNKSYNQFFFSNLFSSIGPLQLGEKSFQLTVFQAETLKTIQFSLFCNMKSHSKSNFYQEILGEEGSPEIRTQWSCFMKCTQNFKESVTLTLCLPNNVCEKFWGVWNIVQQIGHLHGQQSLIPSTPEH